MYMYITLSCCVEYSHAHVFPGLQSQLEEERERHKQEEASLQSRLRAAEEEIGWVEGYTVEPPLMDPLRCGQPPYNGQHERHRLILACVQYILTSEKRTIVTSLFQTTDIQLGPE